MKKPTGSMPESKKRGNETKVRSTIQMLKDVKKRKREVKPGFHLEQVR